MDWLQALILGIIQGLTEFLPISSSGHLVIGEKLLGLEAKENITFEIVVHCATVLSTITILRKEISTLFFKLFKFKWNTETQYIGMILFSAIPVIIVGYYFDDEIKKQFNNLILVGAMLLVTAVLLALSSFKNSKSLNLKSIGWGTAFIIGIAQAIAVLPGLSRSGTTIATGLLIGIKKEEVAKFSFLMILLPVFGKIALDILNGGFSAGMLEIPIESLVIGFFSAYICGCFACKFMIELIKRTNLLWFALYCSIAGAVALIYSLC
jgi:undecaprenyl-diphosphatase